MDGHVDTDQNGLQLIRGAFGLVHEHLLGDVFPVLHTVQPVVGVAVQHRPAQELCQGLEQMRVRKDERRRRAAPPLISPRCISNCCCYHIN